MTIPIKKIILEVHNPLSNVGFSGTSFGVSKKYDNLVPKDSKKGIDPNRNASFQEITSKQTGLRQVDKTPLELLKIKERETTKAFAKEQAKQQN
jgi:hypothetical protein